jgi:hypothetical protein
MQRPTFAAAQRVRGFVQRMYKEQPVLINGTAGFGFFVAGDVISQCIQNPDGGESVNFARSCKVGVLGFFLNGFMLHLWYRALDKAFGNTKPGIPPTWGNVAKKCIADQVVYAPFTCGAFLVWASVLHGGSAADIAEGAKQNLQHSFFQAWAADCTIWPVANLVGFRFVSTNYRPTFIGFVQLGWQTYMSLIGHRHASKDRQGPPNSEYPQPGHSSNGDIVVAKVSGTVALATAADVAKRLRSQATCKNDEQGTEATSSTAVGNNPVVPDQESFSAPSPMI